MTLNQRILKFRTDLLRKQPFYGDIVMQLEFREDFGIPTACTDGICVLYNPHFLNKMTDGQINFILMHEVFHILLLHCLRNRDKDPQIWNVAADFIVNDMLTNWQMMRAMQECGIPFEKPSEGLFASLNAGDTTENLYATIVNDNQSNMFSDRSNSGMLIVRKDYRGHLNNNTNKNTIKVPKAESGQQGGDLLSSKHRENAQLSLEAKVRQMIMQASNNEKNRSPFGNAPIPDAIYRLAESKKLNWKSLLKGMLQDAKSDETSWTTPERKYLHMDLILPGHGEDEETLDEVWTFVDCSGSVGKAEMEQFLMQLYRILKEFHCTMHLAYWDTVVGDVYKSIRSEKKLMECIPHHSGGTNINCVYKWIKENHIKPEVMLVLTDGYFGTLTEENKRLRQKTIVVLSQNSARVDDNIKKVGKPASL